MSARGPVILSIAGSDPSGGAGLQADARFLWAEGAYATSVVAALTAQGPGGVRSVWPVDAQCVLEQVEALFAELPPAAGRIGMLGSRAVVDVVATLIAGRVEPWVLDPVLRASSGAALLPDDAICALRDRLVPRCAVLCPNLPEAEALLGRGITPGHEEEAAVDLLRLGAPAVVLKGGHRSGEGPVIDILCTGTSLVEIGGPRLRGAHGTGCRFAVALALALGRGLALVDATRWARSRVERGLLHPIHHGVGRPSVGD